MDQSTNHKIIKLAIVIILIVAAIVGGYEIYISSKFHVVSTDPSTNNVATLSPFLKINFNKEIKSEGVSIVSPNDVASTFQIQAKQITIYLNYPLKNGKTYVVEVPQISDTSGVELNNLTFTFTAKDTPYNDLPQDEQNALVNTQDHYHGKGINISYVNTNDLINNGMSTTQLALLEKYFSEFSPSAKTVIFNPGSIGVYAAPSPAKAMFKFSVGVDSLAYSAEASYTFLDNLSLSLFSQSGNLVFNSNTYVAPGGD